MRDERKEELKRRARRSVRGSTIFLIMLSIVSMIAMLHIIYQFMAMEVIIPKLTLKTLGIFLGVMMFGFSIKSIVENEKLNAIEDVVLDNKVILEDNVEINSMTMDEIIQLKTKVKNVESIVLKRR